ncbi:hypothetical protein RRG08_015365 [Elysia crispata]|uniref:Uncharacterized protein n=1 Tax=Elysia crispata TaxID=231223 RepID=A0AAE1A9P7_9GAST|nr:hypothetical protein RRG08_015365 [Elysia crispata]
MPETLNSKPSKVALQPGKRLEPYLYQCWGKYFLSHHAAMMIMNEIVRNIFSEACPNLTTVFFLFPSKTHSEESTVSKTLRLWGKFKRYYNLRRRGKVSLSTSSTDSQGSRTQAVSNPRLKSVEQVDGQRSNGGSTENEPQQSQPQPAAAKPRPGLCKQGSVLSNYFPGGRSGPRQRELVSVDLETDNMYALEGGGGGGGGGGGTIEDVVDFDDVDGDEDLDEELLKQANVFIPGKDSPNFGQFSVGVRRQSSSSKSSLDDVFGGSGGPGGRQAAEFRRRQRRQHEELSEEAEEEEEEEEGEDIGDEDHLEQIEDSGVGGKRAKSGSAHRTGKMRKRRNRFHSHGFTRSQPIGADVQTMQEEGTVPKPQRIFKVVFVGDSGVGKSSFLHQFCHHEFRGNFAATIGVDFQVKTLETKTAIVTLQLWDTAGQERYRSMTKTYFRKADGVIVMYDINLEATFTSVRNWMTSVQEQVEPGTVTMLIGNKLDIAEEAGCQAVKTKNGQELARDFEMLFYEVSAKSGANIDEAMESLTRLLQEKEDKKMEEVLQLTEITTKKGCCGNSWFRRRQKPRKIENSYELPEK